MKIIKNMRQLIPGMKVNVYSPKGTKIEHELIVESFYAYTVKLYGMEFAITFGGNTFELVSYPERRKLTWEYAKSKVDEWPIKVYCGEWSYNLECANPKFAYLGYECGCHYWTDEERVFFIDPPHPEVEDVIPTWEGTLERPKTDRVIVWSEEDNQIVMQAAEEDPWVEITPETKVKLPCDAIVWDGYEENRSKGLLADIRNLSMPFLAHGLVWRHAKVRKSSIIQEPAQPTEPDDKVKRLWWLNDGYETHLNNMPKTEMQLTSALKSNQSSYTRYAPGPIVPDESEWKEVK